LRRWQLPDLSGGLDLDKVGDAAQRVGDFGRQIDELAKAVQSASEKAKGK
jgi:hypothetical protein